MAKKDARGGKREGSGRKKIEKTISATVKKEWMTASKKFKEKYGMSVQEYVLCELLHDESFHSASKIGIIKALNEALITKTTESHVTKEEIQGPVIGLPEIKPDPAKLVLLKKAENDK